MANPSLQIGNSNWAIKKDNLLGYSTAGTRFLPIPITMTRASAGTRVNSSGLVENVELLGSELVTNGDYTNGLTGWNTQIPSGQTVEVISNQLHINYDSTGTQGSTGVNQSILTVGKIYKVTIDVASLTGTFKVQVGNRAVPITTAGVHTFYETPTNQQILYIVRSSNGVSFDALINSISAKEVTQNNLARVDYTGSTSSLLAEPQRTNTVSGRICPLR